ncbi:PEP-CTERM sorting domain-containing protein [Massilia sp. H6]|uniref:PEP-CTERM sorting domain-containing protein n=1 Tax=Massilia sp. H6 TaxID=2970464 RepID=UPI002169954A|nr:PEP-CTERM sorting domain-containing protein [Massilia sp. H6]UVW29489.1 PEP-CTERM sorting domain-containing protein [Massilia sp. H6]
MKKTIALGVLSFAAVAVHAGTVSTDDAFTGASINDFSGGAHAASSFDGSLVDPFGVTFFSTDVAGTTGFLNFSTAAAVTLSGIHLFAQSDGEFFGNRRSMSAFRFLADIDNDGVYETTLVDVGVDTNYGNAQTFNDLAPAQDALEAAFRFGRNVTASRFRYEVEQGVTFGSFAGVRVQEIDAIAADVPEPGSFALLGLGLAVLGLRGRKRAARA